MLTKHSTASCIVDICKNFNLTLFLMAAVVCMFVWQVSSSSVRQRFIHRDNPGQETPAATVSTKFLLPALCHGNQMCVCFCRLQTIDQQIS